MIGCQGLRIPKHNGLLLRHLCAGHLGFSCFFDGRCVASANSAIAVSHTLLWSYRFGFFSSNPELTPWSYNHAGAIPNGRRRMTQTRH
ncbi:hypothetical protein [Azospirillum largimobile]